MDITPHDLRNAELREAFRGYRPDEVEELLERAAVALERMHERNRQLADKLGAAEQNHNEGREIEGVMRQTLLLAQRTADEAVATAHERARQVTEEAEDRALSLVTEAENQARTNGEAQRKKYESIVAELSARRDALLADVDSLERVQGDYRSRLRAVLQRELEALDAAPVLPPLPRPELNEIDLAAEPAAQASESEFAPPRPGGDSGSGGGTGSAGRGAGPISLARRRTEEAGSEVDLDAEAESGRTEAIIFDEGERSGNGRSGPRRP